MYEKAVQYITCAESALSDSKVVFFNCLLILLIIINFVNYH